jgi:hypothetical protein
MAYQETWDEITSDPRWGQLSPAMQAKARRKFAQQVRKTEGKEATREFISKHVVAPPDPKASARTRDHLVAGLENVIPHNVDVAKGVVRTVLDEGPTALVRRASGKVADVAYDAVAKPLGLPTSAQQDQMTGRTNRRILPYVAPEDRSLGENIGGIVGQVADPINLVAPLNVFAKAAPVAKGINLLPKAPAPTALQLATRGALGAAATNAAIAGGTSAASQTLDGYPINAQQLAVDMAVGGLAGGALGAGAGLLASRAADAAWARGFNNATEAEAARLAALRPELPAPRPMLALPPARSGPILPADGTVIPAPRGPVQYTPGVAAEDLARSAADDFLRPSYDPDLPTPGRPTAGPAARPYAPGVTLAEREASRAAAIRAEQEAAERARTTHPVADSPFIDAPAPRIHQNPLMDVRAPEPPAPPAPPVQRPYRTTGANPNAAPDSPFIESASPRIHQNPLLDIEPEAPRPGFAQRLLSEESGQAQMPHPDDVAAGVNAVIDGGLDAANLAARAARPIDALIERAIGATRADVPVRMVAGGVRRAKDAAKERMRTGLSGGANEAIDNAGRFFVSSKAPTQYQDLKDAIRSQTIRQMQGLTDEAARLERAGVDQEALYDVVTDATQAGPEADAVRALTNQVSRDLLDVGSLTPQQQAKWDNQYLPRTYLSKDNAVGALVRTARRAVALSGSKRRGKVEELSVAALKQRQRPWEQTGTTADGKVILTDPTNGQTMTVSPKRAADFLADWSNVGPAKGGKVKAWRDWTPTEREAMGELKNVSHALRKMATQAMGDLNNGRLLKAVSENPEWAIRDADGVTPPEGWVLFTKDLVKANGVRKWGALADHWVEPTIARDLAAATNNDLVGRIVKVLRAYTAVNYFKKNKVVYNPASHGTQLAQNLITLEAAGGSVSDVPRAARMLRAADDPTIAQFHELGLYGDDYLSTEGMAGAGANDYLDWGAVAGIPRVVRGVDEWASNLYQFSDNMTRTAYVLGKVDQGVPVEQAIREARERFYNGNTVNSDFARLASASLLPFVKPALYTLDRFPELIEANPVKAVKILAYWFAFDQGFKALSGHLGDEEGRQALLPDYQKGTAKTIPLPFTDTRGQQLLFDYQRMNPMGSTFGVNDRTGFGPVPETFVPTGGPLGGLGQAIANRDLFRDQPLRTATRNDTFGFLAGHFTPGFSANGQRLWRAIWGTPEADGETVYDVPTALAGMVGLKVQPFNPEKGYDKNVRGFEAEANELRTFANRTARALESRHISQEEHDRTMADIEARLEQLAARFEAWDAQAQRGLDAFRNRAR